MKKNIIRVAVIVGLILLIPFFGNIFVDGWNWDTLDFIVMGSMLFVTGLAIDFSARKITRPLYRILVIAGIVLAFLALWTELAVDAVSSIVKDLSSQIHEKKQPFAAKEYKDAEYLVDGLPVRLDGVPATDGLSTTFFGNELVSDLNGDGRDDVTFLITRSGAGSGTFFCVVSALNTERGYIGSSAFFLGDRVAPQSTNKSAHGTAGVIVVNYADRAPNEPFTTKPSMGKSVSLVLDPATLTLGLVK